MAGIRNSRVAALRLAGATALALQVAFSATSALADGPDAPDDSIHYQDTAPAVAAKVVDVPTLANKSTSSGADVEASDFAARTAPLLPDYDAYANHAEQS
ncbi:MAG TPA: hypothetical protein VFC93_06405 [Chloroflexota bacterium]|nr:hypothetical protein [Chloroflexota bacterium]